MQNPPLGEKDLVRTWSKARLCEVKGSEHYLRLSSCKHCSDLDSPLVYFCLWEKEAL